MYQTELCPQAFSAAARGVGKHGLTAPSAVLSITRDGFLGLTLLKDPEVGKQLKKQKKCKALYETPDELTRSDHNTVSEEAKEAKGLNFATMMVFQTF